MRKTYLAEHPTCMHLRIKVGFSTRVFRGYYYLKTTMTFLSATRTPHGRNNRMYFVGLIRKVYIRSALNICYEHTDLWF